MAEYKPRESKQKFRESDKYVFFHGDTWPSQWHTAPMIMDNIHYNCCEQYMMAMKAKLFNDQIAFAQILKANEPSEQKAIGRRVKNFNQQKWDKHKNQIITDANYAKFSQNKKLKKRLLAIGANKIFVEASTSDRIYGIGLGVNDLKADDIKNWKGQNLLGYAITNVRDRLLREEKMAMDVDSLNDEQSEEKNDEKKRTGFLVLGGSFSPCHTEHVELLNEVKKHLEQYENMKIVRAYLVITTDGYVYGKLQDAAIKYKHRRKICAMTASKYPYICPSHVARVNSTVYSQEIIQMKTFKAFFPMLKESERNDLVTVDVCGGDKMSAKGIQYFGSNDDTRMKVCIARKGYNENMKTEYDKAKKEGKCKNFVFVSSECKPISSTLIRKHLLRLRDKLCTNKKSGGWKLVNDKNSKENEGEKQRFRDGVKEMLHPDVIEYMIENIADLWIVKKQNVMGRGQPHNIFAKNMSKLNAQIKAKSKRKSAN